MNKELMDKLKNEVGAEISESTGPEARGWIEYFQGILSECIDELETQWISVEDRLPEQGISVLVYHKDWSTQIERLSAVTGLQIGLIGDEATHWMPLPEPPS